MNTTQVVSILQKIPESALDSVINTLKDHINVEDEDGDTPLILACRYTSMMLALKLIEKGANINAQGYNNDTPLILACYHNCERVATKLYQMGADINVKDSVGRTAIDYVKGIWDNDAKKRFLDLVEPKKPIEVEKQPEVKIIQSEAIFKPEVNLSKYPFTLFLADYLNQNNISYKVESGFIFHSMLIPTRRLRRLRHAFRAKNK